MVPCSGSKTSPLPVIASVPAIIAALRGAGEELEDRLEGWEEMSLAQWPRHGELRDAILAAIDVGNSDPEHRQLHATIIDHGYDIAGLAKAQLHVVTAHPSPMLSSADPVFQLKETIEKRYREQCMAFQAEFDIDNEHLHIEEGPADVLIPHMAHKLEAAVTVIGTVARTGFSGTLIGNTAEVVLDALESDVLVLKTQEIIDHLEELATREG